MKGMNIYFSNAYIRTYELNVYILIKELHCDALLLTQAR